jgi:broad specificity phosphatase PhoE
MLVTLMRHYKVNYHWEQSYTPTGFSRALMEYDKADVVDQKEDVGDSYQQILISALPRTLQTLRFLEINAPFISTELLNEVPIAPFTNRERAYGLIRLNVRARMQWMMGSGVQPETQRQTVARAQELIHTYLDREMNYLIIAHGFFLRVLSQELLKTGFKGEPIVHLKNGERKTYTKTTSLK